MRTKNEKLKAMKEFLYVGRRRLEDEQRHTISVTKLGIMADIPQGSMSQYILGQRLPAEENTDKLADLFGMEIYDILEKPRRMPHDQMLIDIISKWHLLNEDERNSLLTTMQELVNDNES
jgi:hypothetical protein